MLKINPKFILRIYLLENAIRQAEDDNDYSEIENLLKIFQSPYDEYNRYAEYPPEWASQIEVSCSS